MGFIDTPMLVIAIAFAVFAAGIVVGRRHVGAPRRFLGPAEVEVERVGVASGGHMIVVHYRVKKPGRVLRDGEFSLMDEPTGKRMSAPEASKARRVEKTGLGYMLVPNRGDVVRPGSTVTVKLGRRMWEHLVVR